MVDQSDSQPRGHNPPILRMVSLIFRVIIIERG